MWGRMERRDEKPASVERVRTGSAAVNGFDADLARQLLDEAQQLAGLSSEHSPRLVRLGENAVFAIAEQTIARVARSPEHTATAGREIRLAHWLSHAGIPVAAPLDMPQPVIVNSYPVTFWEQVPGLLQPSTFPELAQVLRRMHRLATPPPELALPKLLPFERIEVRIENAPLADRDRQSLISAFTRAQEDWESVRFELPHGCIHGDAHTGNLLRNGAGRLALIDLETAAYGPPEWDLALAGTYATTLGWIGHTEYTAFVKAYGYDVTQAECFPLLRRIRELRMTSWLAQNAAESTEIAREVRHRIACLLDDQLPRRWSRN
jgi:Ser/Thr protein kinase RdoA (MazF antagonist)